jgi:hypothetical protein
MDKKSCGNCRFYREGECRHNSPHVYEGVRVQRGRDAPSLNQLTAHSYLAKWPVVNLGDWCGGWEK